MDEQTFALPTDGGSIQITRERDYWVTTEPGEWLLIYFPATQAMADELVSNAIRGVAKKLEFKHYRDDGSKYWTSRNGIEYLFAVQKKDVRLLDKVTYSYPILVLPGGEQITLNTSGGTWAKGWADFIGNITDACVNHPQKTWAALNAISTKHGSPFDNYLTYDERRMQFYAENEGRWISISACPVPDTNMLEVDFLINGHEATETTRRILLVPKEHYKPGEFGWVLPKEHGYQVIGRTR